MSHDHCSKVDSCLAGEKCPVTIVPCVDNTHHWAGYSDLNTHYNNPSGGTKCTDIPKLSGRKLIKLLRATGRGSETAVGLRLDARKSTHGCTLLKGPPWEASCVTWHHMRDFLTESAQGGRIAALLPRLAAISPQKQFQQKEKLYSKGSHIFSELFLLCRIPH